MAEHCRHFVYLNFQQLAVTFVSCSLAVTLLIPLRGVLFVTPQVPALFLYVGEQKAPLVESARLFFGFAGLPVFTCTFRSVPIFGSRPITCMFPQVYCLPSLRRPATQRGAVAL